MPERSLLLIRWFRWYARRYVRRHFHTVRLARGSSPIPTTAAPLVVAVNHPSWWDPLLGIVISELFPTRAHYVPIDADQLTKYRIFRRLGFYGVESGTLRGAADFLRTSEAILEQPGTMVWITAQGRFADVRQRPLALRPGIGHLAARLQRGFILPLALEYAFWNERTPEAFARFGEPLDVSDSACDGSEWTARIEDALTKTQDSLSADVMGRDPNRFETLLRGRAGIGGFYDRWRQFTSWVRGRNFDAYHGDNA